MLGVCDTSSPFRLYVFTRIGVPQAGGAIFNKGVIKFLKNAFATFRGNYNVDGGDNGGQV